MNQRLDFQKLQQALSPARSILVAVPKDPNLDKMAASLSLYLSLRKAGKTAAIVCPQQMTVEFSGLVGVDKVIDRIGSRNFVISFDYVKDSIEKVSYNVEGNKFNLVIQPKTGFPPLDAKKVSYSYSGIESDLIFIIGAQRLEDLGRLYEKEKNFYRGNQVVNIDCHPQNTQFGKINIFIPGASSYSEIAALILKTLNFPSGGDIATNLLIGLKSATNNFQKASPEAFEAAALCLRAGAGQVEPEKTQKETTEVPSEWVGPKIYKGSTET